MIQNFEPIGIAARDIKECILIQLKAKGQDHPFVSEIVNKHLEDIGKKRYAEIARKLEISLNEVQKIAHLISTIEPRPARDYSPISNNIYIKPDVSITHTQEQGYQIQISEEGIPPLRINSSYKAMLNRPNLTEEEKTFIHERLESAMHFIKSIEQRGRTLREITKYILDRQKDFFEGKLFSIAPMTLKDVAAAIGRNESTISRAVNNKYAETPQGIYPLKFFFSQAMPTTENGNTSAQSIKEEIKDLVASEDKFSPLSDQEIQRHFEEKGVLLARRTVAKYREALSIPPSYLRKKVKLN